MNTQIQIRPAKAIESRIRRGLETDWEIYNFVCTHRGMTVYDLSKILGWSTGKIYHSIKRLVEAKMIRENEEISSGRIIKRIVPVEWTEYFTKEELEDLKNWSGNG